jgi:hypothetical protein
MVNYSSGFVPNGQSGTEKAIEEIHILGRSSGRPRTKILVVGADPTNPFSPHGKVAAGSN